MKARSILGILIVTGGISCVALSLYNFNEFFFHRGWFTWEKVLGVLPLYAVYVATPFLLGILLVIDGRIILGTRRKWTLYLHLTSNLIWLYGTKLLYDLMSQPITDAKPYQQVFYLVIVSLTVFLIGIGIDSARRSTTEKLT